MNRDLWTLTLLAVMAAYSTGAVWLAQVSGYPLWPLVPRSSFVSYYAAWSSAAAPALAFPVVLTTVLAAAALFVSPRSAASWELWAVFAMQGVAVLLTWLWWSPSVAQLTTPHDVLTREALNPSAFARLLQSHWIRVALVTASAMWAFSLLARSLAATAALPAPTRLLLLVTLAFGAVGAGQIWMVQTLCYRVWPLVGKAGFHDYHQAWWHSIWTVIFIPAGVTLAAALALLKWRPPAGAQPLWIAIALQMLLCVLTASWWGPLMARLSTATEGLLLARYQLMLSTHWFRVAIVTAYALVALWMLVQTASANPIAGRQPGLAGPRASIPAPGQ